MNTNCMNHVGRSIKKETVEHIGPADAARTGLGRQGVTGFVEQMANGIETVVQLTSPL